MDMDVSPSDLVQQIELLKKSRRSLLAENRELIRNNKNMEGGLSGNQFAKSIEATRKATHKIETSCNSIESIERFLSMLFGCVEDYLKCEYRRP